MTTTLRRLAIPFLAALFLAACSVSRLAYNNATPLLIWKIDDYVDISGSQREWVRNRLHEAFAWHRSAELPEYRRFVEWAIARTTGTIRVEDAREAWRRLRAYYDRTVDRVLPDAAEFILQLDAGQVAHLEERFGRDNRRFIRENRGSPEERQARATKRLVDQFEDWVGRLERSQRNLIAERVRTFPDLGELRLADRRARQAAFVRLVREKPPRERMVEGLRELLVETQSWRDPAYARKLREREEAVFALVSDLSATMTGRQREHLHRKMRGYSRDIATLAEAHRDGKPQAQRRMFGPTAAKDGT